MNFLDTLSGVMMTDIIIIFVVFALLFFYSIQYGKSHIVSLLISLYIVILTFLSFPYLEETTILKSSEAQVTLSHIAIFIIGVLIIHTILRRVLYTEFSESKFLRLKGAVLLSASATGLLFAFLYHTISFATIYDFGDSIDYLFSSQYFFWWLIIPLVALFITSRE